MLLFADSSFSIGFTIESAVSSERLFGHFWYIFGHPGASDPISGPDFFQRPSLRPGAGPDIKHFHQIELPSSGPRSGNSISSEVLIVFF